MKTAQQQDGTIHCLMALAMPARKDEKEDKKAFKSVLNDKCLASVSKSPRLLYRRSSALSSNLALLCLLL